MSKNITSYNDKGQPHGLWESYYPNGNLSFKGHYLNGQKHGYWESYHYSGQLMYKGYYLNGQKHGYWIQDDKTLFYA
jgi:antitoxin component YwqK of YwqJK toxin-antitoxin module